MRHLPCTGGRSGQASNQCAPVSNTIRNTLTCGLLVFAAVAQAHPLPRPASSKAQGAKRD